MNKRSLIVEFAELRIKAGTEISDFWVISDKVNHIICFNEDSTITYQEGSEKEGNKKETIITTEQIDRVFIASPTLFKSGMIEIRLKDRLTYRMEIPKNYQNVCNALVDK